NHPENTLNDLEMNLSRELQTKEQRIKELEQSKMIADEENQLILSFLWNEIG
ncbi:12721_t:CDS:1, partial [Funneliformis geosporum]